MKNTNNFRNRNGYFIFSFPCVWDLNALKMHTLEYHKTLSVDMDR